MQAYLDGALTPSGRAELERHLDGCANCRAALAQRQEQHQRVGGWLAALDGQSAPSPDAAQALGKVRARVTGSQESYWGKIERSFEMSKRVFSMGRWRPVAVGLVAVLILAGLFSLAPVRQAAADFLGIFRVRKFAVIPVDPQQLEKLNSLQGLMESGMFGEPTFLRQPGQPQVVADIAAASAAAGFNVRAPQVTPPGLTAGAIEVAVGPAMRLEVNREMAQTAMEAAGVQVKLPDRALFTVEMDVPTMAQQRWTSGRATVELLQMPSPTIVWPEGVDPRQLGMALLQALGMSESDAQRLSRTIDWTSTLVIPLPTNIASFREVEVEGASAVLIESASGGDSALLWQREGILYVVSGRGLEQSALLEMAGSLR
jgi:anti-sigma factor RsiW